MWDMERVFHCSTVGCMGIEGVCRRWTVLDDVQRGLFEKI